jgi:subtilisin family serine protease
MASPHVAAVAALMLQKNPSLVQAQVEATLKQTALTLPNTDVRTNIFDPNYGWVDIAWDDTCGTATCDAVGAGLVQADGAIGATPTP